MLRFYFDYVSPYSYLAWTQLPKLGVPVEPVPILFAGLLEAHGTRGPAEVPARRRYLIRDCARIAARFGVPFELPPAHPFNPLLALRLSSLPMPDEQRWVLIGGLFAAVWQTGQGLADPGAIAAAAGLPASALEEAASSEAKARVRRQTDEAIAAGAFGVPTMFVDGQMFFGCDSLPHLERFLASGDAVPPGLADRWEQLPAAAKRS